MGKRRNSAKDAGGEPTFKLVGRAERAVSERAYPSDPTRDAALEVAVKYLRRIDTASLIALIPVFVEHCERSIPPANRAMLDEAGSDGS